MRTRVIVLSIVSAVAVVLLGSILNFLGWFRFDLALPYNDPVVVVATLAGVAPGFIVGLIGLGVALSDAARMISGEGLRAARGQLQHLLLDEAAVGDAGHVGPRREQARRAARVRAPGPRQPRDVMGVEVADRLCDVVRAAGVGAELAGDDGIPSRSGVDCRRPVAGLLAGVVEGMRIVRQIGPLQGEPLWDAREIVAPVGAAEDDDVVGRKLPDPGDQGAHADRLIGAGLLL